MRSVKVNFILILPECLKCSTKPNQKTKKTDTWSRDTPVAHLEITATGFLIYTTIFSAFPSPHVSPIWLYPKDASMLTPEHFLTLSLQKATTPCNIYEYKPICSGLVSYDYLNLLVWHHIMPCLTCPENESICAFSWLFPPGLNLQADLPEHQTSNNPHDIKSLKHTIWVAPSWPT